MSETYQSADTPINEHARVERVRRTGLMDTDQSAQFDVFTELAKKLTGCPGAYTGLLDEERQYFLSRDFGDANDLPDSEVGRPATLCQYALLSYQPLVVEDLREHPILKNNALVQNPPHWQFWAAFPLITHDGLVLGTLCVIDYKPRQLSQETLDLMTRVAETMTRLIIQQMDHREALAEKMHALLGAALTRDTPVSVAALHGFMALTADLPVAPEQGEAAVAAGLACSVGTAFELSEEGRRLQQEHGLVESTYRRRMAAPKKSVSLDDLLMAMED